MSVAIISIGDELLDGHTLDTNFQHLAAALSGAGHRVTEHVTVGDSSAAINRAMDAVATPGRIVILTGGLGGTPDDVTLDAVGARLGRPPEVDAELHARFESIFAERGRRMSDAAAHIARRIPGTERLENPVGLAPGVLADEGGVRYVLLPGVPRELRAIVETSLLPRLGAGPDGRVQTFRAVNVGEGEVARSLADAGVSGVSFLPAIRRVDVAVRLPGGPLSPGDEERLARIVAALGDHLIGDEHATLEDVCTARLIERGETLGLAESLTGGRIAAAFTRVPGVSRTFLGGQVVYSNDAKVRWLGVSPETLAVHGAVSAETAGEMAAGAARSAGAKWGLSTTGIAGPGGATEEKPVGLVYLGLARPDGSVHVVRRRYLGDRLMIVDHTVADAMDLLRRALFDLPLPAGAS